MGRKLPELADDDEPQVTVAIRRGAECAQESAHVLARIELPHVEDVARGHAESGTGERPTLIGWRWIELAVDRFRNDRHALRGDPEPFNDVPLRRFGHRDDRVGAPRERVLPGVPDPRVREPEVMRRPDERRQIVNGHDRRKPASRGQRELRRVIDVDAFACELERKQHRVEREHGELRAAQPGGRDVVMRREKARVCRREVS